MFCFTFAAGCACAIAEGAHTTPIAITAVVATITNSFLTNVLLSFELFERCLYDRFDVDGIERDRVDLRYLVHFDRRAQVGRTGKRRLQLRFPSRDQERRVRS